MHVVSCVGVDRECNHFFHFLNHYISLGVPKQNFHLVFNSDTFNSDGLRDAVSIAADFGLPEPKIWLGPYNSLEMWARRSALQSERVPPDDWVISADVDEFHEYPDELEAILTECDLIGINCIQGPMIDRLAVDGDLLPVSRDHSIWQTFPLQANMPYAIGQVGRHHGINGTVKVMALKGSVFPRRGGHLPYEHAQKVRWIFGRNLAGIAGIKDPRFRFSIPFKVHHFKWTRALLESLESRITNQRQSPASLEYARRIADFLDRNGRIPVNEVPVDGRSLSKPPKVPDRQAWRRWVVSMHAANQFRKCIDRALDGGKLKQARSST